MVNTDRREAGAKVGEGEMYPQARHSAQESGQVEGWLRTRKSIVTGDDSNVQGHQRKNESRRGTENVGAAGPS